MVSQISKVHISKDAGPIYLVQRTNKHQMIRGTRSSGGYQRIQTPMSTRMRQGKSMKTRLANGSQRARNITAGRKNQTRFFGYTVFLDVAKQFSRKVLCSALTRVATKHQVVPRSLNRLGSTTKNSPTIGCLLTSTSLSEIRRSRRLSTSCAPFFPS